MVTVFDRQNGSSLPYRFEQMNDVHMEEILQLQQNVVESLENKDIFVETTEDELYESLREDICTGLYDGERLTAFGLVVINRPSPRNLGILDGKNYHESLTFDSIFVHPLYRGHGLQRAISSYLLKQAEAIEYRFIYATVSPDNKYSLQNTISVGFRILREISIYGGHSRYLLVYERNVNQTD